MTSFASRKTNGRFGSSGVLTAGLGLLWTVGAAAIIWLYLPSSSSSESESESESQPTAQTASTAQVPGDAAKPTPSVALRTPDSEGTHLRESTDGAIDR